MQHKPEGVQVEVQSYWYEKALLATGHFSQFSGNDCLTELLHLAKKESKYSALSSSATSFHQMEFGSH